MRPETLIHAEVHHRLLAAWTHALTDEGAVPDFGRFFDFDLGEIAELVEITVAPVWGRRHGDGSRVTSWSSSPPVGGELPEGWSWEIEDTMIDGSRDFPFIIEAPHRFPPPIPPEVIAYLAADEDGDNMDEANEARRRILDGAS